MLIDLTYFFTSYATRIPCVRDFPTTSGQSECLRQAQRRGCNLTETLNDVTAHAEMQAITSAADYLGGKYLIDCTLYVTVEPCPMCAGALAWAQISRIVYGAVDEKRGCHHFSGIHHPKTEVVGGVLEYECAALMKDFFAKKRKWGWCKMLCTSTLPFILNSKI